MDSLTSVVASVTELLIKNLAYYSFIENTLAATYKDKVDSKEKKLRVGDLEKESKRLGEDIRNKYIGKKLNVLIEEKKSDGFFYGYSENYLRVKLLGDNLKVNDEVEVIIKGLEKGLLISGY